jgi:phage shock protein A
MGFFDRLKTVVEAKANKALDRAEDPREVLDLSYEKQVEMLQQVRRGIADVATSKKRLELQMDQLQESVQKMDAQARQALGAGREDLARTALERKAGAQAQIEGLVKQRDQLEAEQDKLVAAEQKLTTRVEAFRTQKETLKAQYTAAEAETKIGESLSGVSEDMADVGMAMDRAKDKVETMQARAGAIDELLESGALEDPTVGGDSVDRELTEIASKSAVDSELASLKAQIGAGAPQAEIPAGPSAPSEPGPAEGGSR